MMRQQKANQPVSRQSIARASRNTQTTLRLPKQLYERVKRHVEAERADSVNDFILEAVSAYLRALERKAIDDAFRGMAGDKAYQREALRIAQQFAQSDAEAIELSERDLAGT